jgi:hypothetical protein
MRNFVIVASLLIAAAPAQAQVTRDYRDHPRGDFTIALALNGFKDVNVHPACDELALPCISPKTFPDGGFALAFARNVSASLALVFEGGVYRNVWESPVTFPGPGQEVNRVLSLMIGPRVSLPLRRRGERARIFGQVLFGARMSEMVEGSNAIQPGGGIDVALPVGGSLRFELDYAVMRGAPAGPRSIGGARSLIGLVIPFGGQ